MVFPVVIYGCESWTVKKAECWRTDAFELWCWKRLLMLEKIEGRRRRGWQRMKWLDGITNSMDMITGKTIALTRQTFVGKVTSLLFNMLSRLVIAFLSRSKHLLISWLQSPSAVILEPPKIVWHCFHCFPIYLPWSDRTRCHDLRFLNVEL